MKKLPPIQKIHEGYTAIADHRVVILDNTAKISSSNRAKEYIVTWKGNTYTSNDSASYWQGYAGYPVIAVLMLQRKLSLNRMIADYFKGINWTELNAKHKVKYDKAVSEVMTGLEEQGVDCIMINTEIAHVFDEIKALDIEIKRGLPKPLRPQ